MVRDIRSIVALWAIVLAILLQTLSSQMLSAMNGDVAFLFSMAKHTGLQEFYLQYYEVNPPLIIYLYKLFLVPTLFGLNDLAAANSSMTLYMLLCLVIANRYLSHFDHFTRIGLIIAFAAGLAAVSEIMFLQREHIIAAGLVVYVAHALEHQKQVRIHTLWPLTSAIVVAIAFALKPQYLVVLLLVEVTQIIRRRNFTITPLIYWVALLGIVYLLVILIFQRSYVSLIMPLAREYYAGYFTQATYLFTMVGVALVSLVIPFRILMLAKLDRDLVTILSVTAVGCLVAYIMGRTGFGYHFIPAFVFCVAIGVLAFLVGIKQLVSTKQVGSKHRIVTAFYLLVLGVTLHLFSGHYFFRTLDTRYVQAWQNWHNDAFPAISDATLVEDVKIITITEQIKPWASEGAGIVFFAQRMYPHGVIIHSGMQWASRLPNFWLLPLAISRPDDGRSQQVIEMVQSTMATDIKVNQPKIIVVELSDSTNTYMPGFEFLPFFMRSESFKQQFMQYERVSEFDTPQASFAIYVRQE